MRADGDQVQADYLYNTSYWDYHYRLLAFNRFAEAKNEAMKPKNGSE